MENRNDNLIRVSPLRLGIYFGIVGISIDLDHPLAYLKIITPELPTFHPIAMYLSWCILFFVIACCAGLLARLVLK